MSFGERSFFEHEWRILFWEARQHESNKAFGFQADKCFYQSVLQRHLFENPFLGLLADGSSRSRGFKIVHTFSVKPCTPLPPCKKKQKAIRFISPGGIYASLCRAALCLLLLWKSVGNYCSFNVEKLQDELFAGERNSRGRNGTSLLAKHRCTHFPQVSSPRFSTTVLLPAFFGTCKFSAARGNRNICVLTSKVLKLQSVPFRVPYKMISHWLLHGLYSSCWLAYSVLGHLRIVSLRTS